MNSKIFRQADSRWGKLKYPSGGYNVANSGCGLCAVTHNVIEIPQFKNYTPKTVRPFMVKYATKGHGTLWEGIKKGLEHYGYKVHWNMGDSMSTIFNVLENSLKRGVILFGSKRGPDGTVWTSSGHYIAFEDYKIVKGKHYFYLKDSGGRKHDGWWCYEKSMKGDVKQVWICTALEKSSTKKSTEAIAKEVIAGKWGNGSDRKKKLKASGYDPAKVQKKVNELLKK